jgi:hypothetical protein
VRWGGALRRIVLTELVYGALAVLGWWVIDPVRQTFLLPALFSTLARAALVLGFPLAGLMAWRYPELGGGAPDGGEGA